LKAAGGILMGKTNVAPLLADFQTNNEVFAAPIIPGILPAHRAVRAAGQPQRWLPA